MVFQSLGHDIIDQSTCGTSRHAYCTSFILINNVAWSTNVCDHVKSFQHFLFRMYAWGLVAFMQSLCNAKQHALLSVLSRVIQLILVHMCFLFIALAFHPDIALFYAVML